MSTSAREQLQNAIARNSAAVLSLPSAGMLRHQKSRFLEVTEDGFWMECGPDEILLVDDMIESKKLVGITYKSGITKTVFTTQILSRDENYRINDTTTTFAVRLKMPAEIKTQQRRSTYRVKVQKDFELRVEVWRMAPRWVLRDKPSNRLRVNAEMINISTGGMSVFFIGENGQKPIVCEQDRLRIFLRFDDIEVLLEGMMKFPLPTHNVSRIRAGVQFKSLDHTIEGRVNLNKLTKVIGSLQRHEIRRLRMGMGEL